MHNKTNWNEKLKPSSLKIRIVAIGKQRMNGKFELQPTMLLQQIQPQTSLHQVIYLGEILIFPRWRNFIQLQIIFILKDKGSVFESMTS